MKPLVYTVKNYPVRGYVWITPFTINLNIRYNNLTTQGMTNRWHVFSIFIDIPDCQSGCL